MKKVLGIFCHPDDEILFGWPIFQAQGIEKYLIICCDDSTRKGPGRRQALQEVCKQEGINLIGYLSEDNNFYALPTRNASNLLTDAVKRIEKALEESINQIHPDCIFTHNPMGEYGHGSHRLLFELVSQNENVKNLLITDICQESNHRSYRDIPWIIREAYYTNWQRSEKLDWAFYCRNRVIYNAFNAWTWNKEPVESCNLYLLKENV